MRLPKFIKRLYQKKNAPVVVTFTGGMGAQVISAAIYFSLRNKGQMVYADLSYFERKEDVAKVGHKGQVSHWSWQLESFGLTLDCFETASGLEKHRMELIEDGPKKLQLGLQGLKDVEVQRRFAIQLGIQDVLPAEFASGYLCVHVRRGDYVNVGSDLVSDERFVELASKLATFAKNLVVVSDSPIEEIFRQRIATGYERAIFLDDIDAFTTHRVMRKANILICSNSQFSLIAALLNSRALVFYPKRWFVPNQQAIEQLIHESCEFQILDTIASQ